jgi:hypothetical protein
VLGATAHSGVATHSGLRKPSSPQHNATFNTRTAPFFCNIFKNDAFKTFVRMRLMAVFILGVCNKMKMQTSVTHSKTVCFNSLFLNWLSQCSVLSDVLYTRTLNSVPLIASCYLMAMPERQWFVSCDHTIV